MPNGRRPWDAEDAAVLLRMHSEGASLVSIAKKLERSPATVSLHAKRAGLGFDRSKTEKATHAAVADAKARRAALALDLLRDAERLREQLWSPTKVYNFGGKDNTYAERTVAQPPHAEQLKIVQAVNTTIGALERLDKMDADNGIDAAVGMLDGIAKAIEKVADTMPDPDE